MIIKRIKHIHSIRVAKRLYTKKHRRAILSLYDSLPKEKQLCSRMKIRLHDIDKVIMLYLPLPLSVIQTYHRSTKKHHIECPFIKTGHNVFETVLDMECARKTKPDKPLPARETLVKYYKKDYDISEYLAMCIWLGF